MRNVAISRLLLGIVMVGSTAYGQETTAHVRPSLPTPEEIEALPPDGGDKYNRLVFEQSPYLLQHAANPVDWYPWGAAAFEKAQAEDKPVFLSIGYSTCHWCHVMERESFENEDVAAVLNEHFVPIKVDREERPDIDALYMEAAFAISGAGGWPLNVFLTPDKKPFYAGTYFPPEERFGRPGFKQVLERIAQSWRDERDKVLQSANHVVTVIEAVSGGAPGEALTAETMTAAYDALQKTFDAEHGGFGSAPKFPSPHNLLFLLRHWRSTGEEQALHMVEETLQAMRRGGIWDHLGYGFHRYATDREWLVPHFEKMLYDQAMLAMAYVEAWQATGDAFYAQTAREILTYVLRDMTDPKGGFYSAEDADSEGEEGKFYVWTREELDAVLGEADAERFAGLYNATPAGNWTDEASGEKPGTNILHITGDLPDDESIATMRRELLEVREQRVHPLKDDKILTDWNGLMIAAFAKAGRAFGDDTFMDAANSAADRVLADLRRPDGRLIHRLRGDVAGLPAHLDDYAFLIWGLIELFEATFDVARLETAIQLMELQNQLFWDEKEGGYFLTASDAEPLLVRQKAVYDGAIPSGNSVSALNLLRLGRMTARAEWEEQAELLIKAFSRDVNRAPAAHAMLLCGLSFAIGPAYEVVLAGDRESSSMHAMLRALRTAYIPNKVVLHRPAGEAPAITALAEYTKYQIPTDGTATAYVCRNYACDAPTTDPAVMMKNLHSPSE